MLRQTAQHPVSVSRREYEFRRCQLNRDFGVRVEKRRALPMMRCQTWKSAMPFADQDGNGYQSREPDEGLFAQAECLHLLIVVSQLIVLRGQSQKLNQRCWNRFALVLLRLIPHLICWC